MSRRLCFVISNSYALNTFLADPICRLARDGWQIDVVYNDADGQASEVIARAATLRPQPLVRPIAPLRDLVNLWRLWRLFRRERYQVIHSVTPKAGLLAMVAGRLAGVPRRIHTFTGQVWATRGGATRRLLQSMDILLAKCATDLLADSPSQREFLVNEGVVPMDRVGVLARGSICGVSTERFRPNASMRVAIRLQWGVSDNTVVLLYLGRLHREKGLLELTAASGNLVRQGVPLALVMAGPDEGVLDEVRHLARQAKMKVCFVGMTSQPEYQFAAADIFCLPSYREGFGLSLIEAASAGLPSVATRIYGVTDAVVDGETGLLVPPGDVAALETALHELILDSSLRSQMGIQARIRATKHFSREVLMQAWSAYYSQGKGSLSKAD